MNNNLIFEGHPNCLTKSLDGTFVDNVNLLKEETEDDVIKSGKLYYINNMTLYYHGAFSKGNPHGKNSTLYHKNGKIGFFGNLLNGFKEGYGEIFEENGMTLLQGDFKNECFYNGEVVLDNVTIDYPHEGFFEKNEQVFIGKFSGECASGVLKGRIKSRNTKSSVVGKNIRFLLFLKYFYQLFIGEFELLAELDESSSLVNNCSVRPKLCKFMNYSGILKYVGQFIDGRLGGYGISFDENGKMNRKGLFKNGFFQNRGILYDKNNRITYIGGKSIQIFRKII